MVERYLTHLRHGRLDQSHLAEAKCRTPQARHGFDIATPLGVIDENPIPALNCQRTDTFVHPRIGIAMKVMGYIPRVQCVSGIGHGCLQERK
ncbi:hypothetical protein D3C72_2142960 [compost metagenome]